MKTGKVGFDVDEWEQRLAELRHELVCRRQEKPSLTIWVTQQLAIVDACRAMVFTFLETGKVELPE